MSTRAVTTRSRNASSPWAPVAWSTMSLVLFLASSLAIFVVTWVVRGYADLPHLVEMAGWSVLWGICSVLGVLIAGRLAFGRRLPVPASGLGFAAAGIALSAVVNVVLQQWVIARFGYFDSEFVGWTAALFAVMVGLATATLGVFVAPRGAVRWPLTFVLLGAGMVVFIVLANVPGLRDGIEPESWPLAFWLGASGLYAAVVCTASLLKARPPGAE